MKRAINITDIQAALSAGASHYDFPKGTVSVEYLCAECGGLKSCAPGYLFHAGIEFIERPVCLTCVVAQIIRN